MAKSTQRKSKIITRNFILLAILTAFISSSVTYYFVDRSKKEISADAAVSLAKQVCSLSNRTSDSLLICIAGLQKNYGPAGYSYRQNPGFIPSDWWANKTSSSYLDCSAYVNVVLWLTHGEIMNWGTSRVWAGSSVPAKRGAFTKITNKSSGFKKGDIIWREGHVAIFSQYAPLSLATDSKRKIIMYDASEPGTVSGYRMSDISKFTHGWRYTP